ncbi:hypothetical protein C8R47DRAFT_1324501 [Mycena vitilis]|nr:hypothetical protein C8R47DRAFT_1324501 [Mycena vitilis]
MWVDIEILCYQGQDPDPRWIDIESEKYRILCKVHADTSKTADTLKPQYGQSGSNYKLEFDVVLFLALAELSAQICWIENGVEKRGPAEIVY